MKKVIIGVLTAIGALTIFVVVPFFIITNSLFPIFEWKYEELKRIESPDGQFEIVSFRGNAGAVSGYTYELYVVEKGRNVDREMDSSRQVLTAYEDTQLLGYQWVDDTVEIAIDDGAVRYKTYYGTWEEHNFRKVGDVVLRVRRL